MTLIKLNRHFLWDQVGQHQTGWSTLISNRYHPVIIGIIIIFIIIIIISIIVIIIIFLITISIINVICIVIFITITIITSSSNIFWSPF